MKDNGAGRPFNPSIQQSLKAAFMSVLLLLSSTSAMAAADSFRNQFIMNYKSNRFQQQVELVKKNKETMPGEIKALTAEALSPDKDYEERMFLLDVANAMGSMYKSWHGDERPLIEVETIQKLEITREQARTAEAERWAGYEKMPGNFLMKEHIRQMEAAGQAPVLFPHWLHRVWFQCKVCHEENFVMQRGANDVSHTRAQCEACHGSKGPAFGVKGNCERCHNAGKEGSKRLLDMKDPDNKRIKEAAARAGAEWNYENLPGGRLPLDRFGFVDWQKLKELKVIRPAGSVTKGSKDEVRENKIIFKPGNEAMNNVLFDHRSHSEPIKCSSCHTAVFKDSLGANDIKMTGMSAGRFCGYCHGKVSFTFADCERCHNTAKGALPAGAIIREQKTR